MFVHLEPMVRSTVSPPRPTTLLFADPGRESSPDVMVLHDNNNDGRPARRKKKRRPANTAVKKFEDLYVPTGENLGKGSTGSVQTYRNLLTDKEYAVKIVKKTYEKTRNKVLKEIEIFHHCRGHENILQLIEYFEEEDQFYLVFEKMEGGTLLETIERRGLLTEQEASMVVRDIARALDFLHRKGIAHRDLKPENILCVAAGQLTPVKICDFDLGSGVVIQNKGEESSPVTTPELSTPVGSAEFMAPEVVDVWQDQAWSYDKKCDLWSLGIILYIMLSGYAPFYGNCGDECGWEQGEACENCQNQLFNRIQDGHFDMNVHRWGGISEEAKDLIRHLLVRDPNLRYSAPEVLRHTWVAMESPMAQLDTPRVLQRNNSVKELESFAENANAMKRMLMTHLSITEAYKPSCWKPWSEDEEECSSSSKSPEDTAEPIFSMPVDARDPLFQIGSESDHSSEEEPDEAPILWMGLTPPGQSGLARRRARKKCGSENSESSEMESPPEYSSSPPKVHSAMF